jgi:exonuclease VII small subunit
LSDVPGYEERKPAARKRVNPIKRKQLEERCQQVEQAIAQLESGIAECERELQSFVSAEETARWTGLLAQRRDDLGPLMAEWEELSQVLEQANA